MNKTILEDLGLKEKFNYTKVKFHLKNLQHPDERIVLNTTSKACDFTKNLFGMDIETRELFFAVLLNSASQVLAVYEIGTGGINACTADIRMILLCAINCQASGLVVTHNHPSSNTTPSESDIKFTNKLKAAAALMDVKLQDHIIITEYSYYSFFEEGQL